MTDRDIELGSVPEEADGTERDQQHRGGQTKMPGLDATEDTSAVPGTDGECPGYEQRPTGDLEPFLDDSERLLGDLERLPTGIERRRGTPDDLSE